MESPPLVRFSRTEIEGVKTNLRKLTAFDFSIQRFSLEKLMKKIITLASLASLLGLVVACTKPQTTTTAVAPAATSEVTTVDEVPAGHKLVQAKKTATLRIKFVMDGKAPAPAKIDASRDAFCAANEIFSDDLMVSKDGAIKNIAIYLDEKKSKIEISDELRKAPDAVHKLDNKGCMFEPQVFHVRTGQNIDVINSDQTGHNANFNFFKNDPINMLIPIGGNKLIEGINLVEPAPIPIECNVHPWMKANVIVTDHPFVGISNEEGVLEITDIPPGEVTFRVWHKIGKIDEAMVDGKKQKWSKGRMEIELKPGMNDLGEVKISADAFEQE
jgi:plastocyanin